TGTVPPDRPDLARCKAGSLPLWEARLSEIEAVGGTTSTGLADQLPGSVSVPLIVLRPGGPAPPQGLPKTDPLADLSPRSEVRVVPNSSHMMMFDRPDAIVDAVRDVLRIGASEPPAKAPGAP
ncbi:MAG: alpha/beta fold hydrolase, partial [Sandaracinobacteroides sp.]